MNALNTNNIPSNNGDEKTRIVDSLKKSIDNLNLSPKMKVNSFRNINIDTNGVSSNTFRVDEVTFGKGRKHYGQHPNFVDNVKFDYKDYYDSPNDRIEELINFYTKIGDEDRKYRFNPELKDFYNKEKLDPLFKNPRKIKHMNVSQANINIRSGSITAFNTQTSPDNNKENPLIKSRRETEDSNVQQKTFIEGTNNREKIVNNLPRNIVHIENFMPKSNVKRNDRKLLNVSQKISSIISRSINDFKINKVPVRVLNPHSHTMIKSNSNLNIKA